MTPERKELIILAEKALQKLQPIGWDPLDSDADCFRMETELEINVFFDSDDMGTFVGAEHIGRDIYCGEPYDINLADKAAARRLASTRVAAEIGKRCT